MSSFIPHMIAIVKCWVDLILVQIEVYGCTATVRCKMETRRCAQHKGIIGRNEEKDLYIGLVMRVTP